MKKVLITGASRGIGKSLAIKFAKEGYQVITTYKEDDFDFDHEYIKSFQLDLTSTSSIENFVKTVKKKYKKIDLLINNAGVLKDKSLGEVHIDRLVDTLKVNLIGTIELTEQLINCLPNGGAIINISSRAGQFYRSLSSPNHPSYKISKAALNMYTVTLAKRLESKDITVSSVHPGWVKTDMGGPEADLTPKEAAEHICKFAKSKVNTGSFWFKSEQMEW